MTPITTNDELLKVLKTKIAAADLASTTARLGVYIKIAETHRRSMLTAYAINALCAALLEGRSPEMGVMGGAVDHQVVAVLSGNLKVSKEGLLSPGPAFPPAEALTVHSRGH